jgi:hypothetical protein
MRFRWHPQEPRIYEHANERWVSVTNEEQELSAEKIAAVRQYPSDTQDEVRAAHARRKANRIQCLEEFQNLSD